MNCHKSTTAPEWHNVILHLSHGINKLMVEKIIGNAGIVNMYRAPLKIFIKLLKYREYLFK